MRPLVGLATLLVANAYLLYATLHAAATSRFDAFYLATLVCLFLVGAGTFVAAFGGKRTAAVIGDADKKEV